MGKNFQLSVNVEVVFKEFVLTSLQRQRSEVRDRSPSQLLTSEL